VSQTFLVELGTEELPPKALKNLAQSFEQAIAAGLTAANIGFGKTHVFAAPRRLAVSVEELIEQQPDQSIEKLGPNVSGAFDAEGKPTKAAEGFARSCGIEFAQLQRTQTDKGERLVFRSTQPGKLTIDLLPGIVTSALEQLPIPKRMRWGARRVEFVRPAHWLVMLFGKQIIDCEILGIKSGRETRGHRFHCNQAIVLNHASEYQLTLENKAYVIADFSERRGHVRAQVEVEGKKCGGVAVIDEDLLDEVTALVEWPVALSGSFEERFLSVPQEALISSMKGHQKYFHVVDANGKLLPNFITVANIESKEPRKVIDGNERVIRPRLSDAAFFYETDLKTPLAVRREKLNSVVFQEKLGTVFAKTERIAQLAAFIAAKIHGNTAWAQRAGELSKADLVSNMVGEFDEMQGVAGAYYALHDGEPAEVAQALREHYLPRFAGDELPATATGVAVALADRLDTLVGIFGIGQPPTGSKDPFALRRAALGVLRLIVEKGFDLDLRELLQKAQAQYPQFAAQTALTDNVLDYLIERFRARFEDENIAAEVFMAVSAKKLSQPLDINQRVQAVFRFSQLPEAQALAAANKRVSNILAKQGDQLIDGAVNSQLLTEVAEKELALQVAALQDQVGPLFAARKYREGLEQLASLRGAVDAFFDNVMVMADDIAVRNNRLALLLQLRNLFLEVADISLLAPAK
jgi:glycyl-tRNA synthetase beta chain